MHSSAGFGLLLPALSAAQTFRQYNDLAVTPQMGWDNWNAFACSVSHDLIVESAHAIKVLGLKDLGYEYINLDDCWQDGRNETSKGGNGSIIADTTKFPHGMAALASAVHDHGFKFGMYSSAGFYTCGRYEASLNHEEVDALTFANWGVDYLKYDNCYNDGGAGTQRISSDRYRVMSDALKKTGREILYAICNWGEDSPWNWGTTQSNSWRITGDVYDSFSRPDARCPCDGEDAFNCRLPGFHCSIMNIANKASFVVSKAQPGGWNDLDMLTVGLGGMTDPEYITHFSLWSAVKSPLIMGNDLSKITPAALSILNNPAIIAVNQDSMGSSASRRVYRVLNEDQDEFGYATEQMWSGNLNSTTWQGTDDGDIQDDAVVVLINGRNSTANLTASLADIFVDSGPSGDAPQVGLAWEVRDLWGGRMSESQAADLISNTNRTVFNGGMKWNGVSDNATRSNSTTAVVDWFNATETSYSEGLRNQDERLLGTVTTTVQPSGTITAELERHGAAMFRLRAMPTGDIRKRTEL